MKIASVETVYTREFENVIWVRIHTDAGIVGLGETFYGAAAVAAHIQDTLAIRLPAATSSVRASCRCSAARLQPRKAPPSQAH